MDNAHDFPDPAGLARVDSVQGGGDDVPLNAGLSAAPEAAGVEDTGDTTPDPRFSLPPVETPSLDRKSTTVAVNDLIAGLPTRYGAVLRGEAADTATSAKGLAERVREGLGLTLDEHIAELERNFHIKPQVSAQLRREGAAAQAPFLKSASQLEGDRYGAELRAQTGAQLDHVVDAVRQTPERLPVMVQSARQVVANAENTVLGEGESQPLLRETQRKLGLAALDARLKRGPAELLGYIKAGGAAELKPLGVSDAEIARYRAQAQSAVTTQAETERKAREAAAATRGLTGFIKGTTPFDPANPAHVRTAEAGFEAAILPRLANPATAAEGAAAAIAYVKALKLVPPGLASWMGRGLTSTNPEEAARAAEVYAAIADAAPRKLPEGAGNPQSLYAMTIAALRRQGYAPADVVRVAGERVLRSNRDSQGFLARGYDADRPAIAAGTARFLAGAGVALGPGGRARFDAMVREAYGRTGEIDAARAVALMQWRRGAGAPRQDGPVAGSATENSFKLRPDFESDGHFSNGGEPLFGDETARVELAQFGGNSSRSPTERWRHVEDPETVEINGISIATEVVELMDEALSVKSREDALKIIDKTKTSILAPEQRKILRNWMALILSGQRPTPEKILDEMEVLGENARVVWKLRHSTDNIPVPSGRALGRIARGMLRPPPIGSAPADAPPEQIESGRSSSGTIAPREPIREFTVGSKNAQGRIVFQPTNDPNKLLAGAKDQEPILKQRLAELAEAVDGVSLAGVRRKDASAAGLQRLQAKLSKTTQRAELMSDYLGGRLYVASPGALRELLREFGSKFKVVEFEDFLDKPRNGSGYRAVHVQVSLPNGMTAEIQIWPDIYKSFADRSHKSYEAARSFLPRLRSQEISEQIKKDGQRFGAMYKSAYERWLQK